MKEREQDLCLNLKLICGRHRSIADICRGMRINRQQFNKYLSGQSRPSLHTLNRIAEYFELSETELLLPHKKFTRVVVQKPRGGDVPHEMRRLFASLHSKIEDSQRSLKAYTGYYYVYHRSPAWPDSMVKSLMVITQDHQLTYAKTIERLVRVTKPHLGCFVHKYHSIVHFEADRVYIIDRQYRGKEGMSMQMVYPSERSHIRFLQGLLLSVTTGSGRRPFATRTVLEYLGKRVALKQALRSCGVYPLGSDLVDTEIWRDTTNEFSEADGSLTARMT